MARKNPAAVALGRLGGAATSAAKAAASRANGAKGGRPPSPCPHGTQRSRCRACRQTQQAAG